MTKFKTKDNAKLYTLGPVGTDAYNIAKKITNNIELCESFPLAMERAFINKEYALICCGYINKDENKQVIDSWVNLNFNYLNKMKIIDSFFHKTKTMCIAKNKEKETIERVIIHPATECFLDYINFDGEVVYSNNKPTAVLLTAMGDYDACIGSKDIVKQYSQLDIMVEFSPQMVWCIYSILDE